MTATPLLRPRFRQTDGSPGERHSLDQGQEDVLRRLLGVGDDDAETGEDEDS